MPTTDKALDSLPAGVGRISHENEHGSQTAWWQGLGVKGNVGLVLNSYRRSVLQDKSIDDRWWGWLYTIMNVFNTNELY